jgi:hypothetical protein
MHPSVRFSTPKSCCSYEKLVGNRFDLWIFDYIMSGSTPKQLSPEEIHNLKTFKDWCVNQERLPSESKRVMAELLRRSEIKDCVRAAKKLASVTGLALS